MGERAGRDTGDMEIWSRIQSLYLGKLPQFFTNKISRNQVYFEPHVHTVLFSVCHSYALANF